MQAFIRAACREEACTDTIDDILAKIPAATQLDNFGTAPTVGTYALQLIPISGLAQSLYGLVMSGVILNRCRKAHAILRAQAAALKVARNDVLVALQRLKDKPDHAKTAAVLRGHLAAINAHEINVAAAQRRAFNNMSMPGGVRMLAAASIMGLGIERAPTIVGATSLLPSLVGVVLGSVGGGLLAVFGVAWLTRNSISACRAWRTPTYGKANLLGASDELQTYLKACNRHTHQRRAYHTINTVAALAYIGAAITLVLASNGMAAIPMTALPAVAAASTTSLVAELALGKKLVPHNAQTPHLDRVALRGIAHRMKILAMLEEERTLQTSVRGGLLRAMPRHHKQGRSLNPKRLWTALPKTWRYNVWRILPAGDRRLGAWCRKDARSTDPRMLDYLSEYNRLEMATLEHKLQNLHKWLQPCGKELDVQQDPQVRKLMQRAAAGLNLEHKRLQSMHALHHFLAALEPGIDDVRNSPDLLAQWHQARIGFLVTHRLEYHFFKRKHVEQHPELFDCEWTPRRLFKGRDLKQVRVTERAMQHAADNFDAEMEGRFANLLLNPGVVDYEIHAVRSLDEDARRTNLTEVETQLAALKQSESAAPPDLA